IEDAAVARLADLPIHLEVEVAELVFRHDVGDATVLGQRAVGDLPARGNLVGLVAAPRVEIPAVEQHAPSGLRRLTGYYRWLCLEVNEQGCGGCADGKNDSPCHGEILHIAQCDGFTKSGERVPCRDELVGEIAGESGVHDGLRDRAP